MSETKTGRIVSVNLKDTGGIWKQPRPQGRLIANFGLEAVVRRGDAITVLSGQGVEQEKAWAP